MREDLGLEHFNSLLSANSLQMFQDKTGQSTSTIVWPSQERELGRFVLIIGDVAPTTDQLTAIRNHESRDMVRVNLRQIANLGIVGDVLAILPALTKAFKEQLGK